MKTILVVDDQPQISKLLNDLLTHSGYEVHLAFNGEMGYKKALEIKPNLIVMDIMMPVMSGFDSVKEMRKYPELAKTPIIFLTARGLESDKTEAEKLGAVAFVTKPFSPKQFVQIVKQQLGD